MKAELESNDTQYRGVTLTSENLEESQLLNNIWLGAGKVIMFSRLRDTGQVQLVVAPTPERPPLRPLLEEALRELKIHTTRNDRGMLDLEKRIVQALRG